MKLTFKFLLVSLIVFAAIYAFFPVWFPQVLSTQLPTGWQLEQVDTDYPGISAVRLNKLKVKSYQQVADISLGASDISFDYRGFKTRIASITLDVFLHGTDDSFVDRMTLDDLSIPVLNMAGELPELSISSLRIRLHQAQTGTAEPDNPVQPLVLDFGGLNLVPGTDSSFHLATEISLESIPIAPGLLELDVTPHSQRGKMQFPADLSSPKWLSVSADNDTRTTRIQTTIDTALIDHQWLDSILLAGTGGLIKHMEGQIKASAEFAGPGAHELQQLSLGTEDLRLQADGESLELKTSLVATREAQEIVLSVQDQTLVRYRDTNGRIDRLLASTLAGFQHAPRPLVETVLRMEPGSKLAINTAAQAAIGFKGDIGFELESGDETLKIESSDISVAMTRFPKLETMTIDGLAHIEWNEGTDIEFALPGLQMTAGGLSVSADITSIDSEIVSNGHGSLFRLNLPDMDTSANQVDLRWQNLDLLDFSGKLFTQTHGFNTTIDGDTWTGFDFKLDYRVMNGKQLDGSGKIIFDNGPELPIEFDGNVVSNLWKVTLPSSRIKAGQVSNLLKFAKIDLPKHLKLDNGVLEIQGEIIVDEEIKATMIFNGRQFSASIRESRADDGDFSFKAALEQELSVDGPISIETVSLAGGIDLTQLSTELSVTGADSLTMQNIRANVFEGQLHLATLQYTDGEIADTRAEFTHINLNRILAFAEIDGLDGTGYLDASFPLSQKPSGMIINNGIFNSTGAGRLSYVKEAVVAANIGMQALENFHYKQLSGTINYKADGEYQISIRLEGSNPDLYEGYPVIFNLSINGVMPALFESMFITGSFEEAILKQVKSQ